MPVSLAISAPFSKNWMAKVDLPVPGCPASMIKLERGSPPPIRLSNPLMPVFTFEAFDNIDAYCGALGIFILADFFSDA